MTGGGEEYGLRPGPLNVPGIAGIGEAARILSMERHADARRIVSLRDQLLAKLREALPGIRLNGSLTRRLPANLNITIPPIDADPLIDHLPRLALSTTSACTTAHAHPSHILAAIALR